MAQRTEKIENDHADEQMEVSGSEIDTNSEGQDEFNVGQKSQIRQSNLNNGGNYDNIKIGADGGYQASDYAHLPVSMEIKELFKSIQRYTPIVQEIDAKLKAFIPDYVPAIGEVDAFLKMPRPDGKPEILGLNILDEPSLNQTDKAKADQIYWNNNKVYKEEKYSKVHSIESAQKNPKQITNWISTVADIRPNKPSPSVSYSKRMPDIDSLMQVWPPEVEQVLSDINVPSQEIDLSLEEYCKVACNILDIPVHREGQNNVVESLHVMFTLFSAFKQNQHFQQENESYVNN